MIPRMASVILDTDWSTAYEGCPRWRTLWANTRLPGATWPEGIQLFNGKMYLTSLLCVPITKMAAVIHTMHRDLGHPGPGRLWQSVRQRYLMAVMYEAKQLSTRVPRSCSVCQVCEPPPLHQRWSHYPYSCSPTSHDIGPHRSFLHAPGHLARRGV